MVWCSQRMVRSLELLLNLLLSLCTRLVVLVLVVIRKQRWALKWLITVVLLWILSLLLLMELHPLLLQSVLHICMVLLLVCVRMVCLDLSIPRTVCMMISQDSTILLVPLVWLQVRVLYLQILSILVMPVRLWLWVLCLLVWLWLQLVLLWVF